MTAGTGVRTATFLMSDIEGSTRLWQAQPDEMAVALRLHDDLLQAVVAEAGGTIVKTTGDGMLAVFDRADAALAAAVNAQYRLLATRWPTASSLVVRMAIHAGSVEERGGDYFGPTLNRLARLLAIGHGGQILLSAAAAVLATDRLPSAVELLDRGEHRLRDLSRPERVLELRAPGLPRDFPPLRSASPQTNLPGELTSFVGREREQAALRTLLASHRLVTLVGVGGTGKTRLMLRVAAELADGYADGTWLVELASITDPDLVPQAIGRAVSVPDVPDRPALAVLMDYLREKDLLLLLDNCEHLIDAVADIAERLLATCRSLHVMATSREALGTAGEAILQVPSLAVPAGPETTDGTTAPSVVETEAIASTEAVRLFVDRAHAVDANLQLDPEATASIGEICRRLDGIPLAIELAASRVSVLSVSEIASRLDDRFRLLTGGRRTAVPRQQTLQALIDWSWDLLAEPDQRLLRCLSAFAGGWSLDAAAAVAADDGLPRDADSSQVLDGLTRLADRSLVVVDRRGATRYRMLETIRQYARDRLVASGEAVAVRGRHLGHFRDLALEADAHLDGPDLLTWLDRLDGEIENLRAALAWAFDADLQAALEMTAALAAYWRHRSVGTEGSDRLRDAVEAVARLPEPAEGTRQARAVLVARVTAAAAVSAATTNRDLDRAARWADDAVASAREGGQSKILSQALMAQGLVALFSQAPEQRTFLNTVEETARLAEAAGAWSSLAFIAAGVAQGMDTMGDRAQSDAWLARSTDAAARSGNPDAIAFAVLGRGRVLTQRRDLEGARPWFLRALAGYRALNDRRMELITRSDLAHALRRGGNVDEAGALYRETVREWQRLGNRGAIANQLEAMAFLASATGQPQRAALLLGAAERLRHLAGAEMLPHERQEYDDELRQLRAVLDADTLAESWAAGAGLSADEAIAVASAEPHPRASA